MSAEAETHVIARSPDLELVGGYLYSLWASIDTLALALKMPEQDGPFLSTYSSSDPLRPPQVLLPSQRLRGTLYSVHPSATCGE